MLCKLREWSVIVRDYEIFHSKLVGINKAKKLTSFKIERNTKLNTNSLCSIYVLQKDRKSAEKP